ncbi:MAG: glycosyltransferase [Deltaproteobacteria bacterium]|nr:MAG: glycosyltransferase [Deltaproteobacteria bacterium]
MNTVPPALSVVIPLCNEADAVEPLVAELRRVLDGLGRPAELIVVDDGSDDGSYERLRAVQRGETRLRIVRLARNYGQTAALAAGIEQARAPIIITLDADLNIDPRLQADVLAQFEAPALVACDTIGHWIDTARGPFEALLPRIDLLVVNDEEARLLSGERNVVRAARKILALGTRAVLVKRGEYGAILFSPGSVFAVPAYPLEEVFDPTGAGDAFAGGLMGALAAGGDRSETGLRRAIVYGTVLASFIVEDFGGRRLTTLTRDDIERRHREFVALTEF